MEDDVIDEAAGNEEEDEADGEDLLDENMWKCAFLHLLQNSVLEAAVPYVTIQGSVMDHKRPFSNLFEVQNQILIEIFQVFVA